MCGTSERSKTAGNEGGFHRDSGRFYSLEIERRWDSSGERPEILALPSCGWPRILSLIISPHKGLRKLSPQAAEAVAPVKPSVAVRLSHFQQVAFLIITGKERIVRRGQWREFGIVNYTSTCMLRSCSVSALNGYKATAR